MDFKTRREQALQRIRPVGIKDIDDIEELEEVEEDDDDDDAVASDESIQSDDDVEDQTKAMKMFNLYWVNQRLDAVVSELAKDKNRNTEIIQATQLIEIARQLMKNYSDRLRVAETS